MIVYSGTKTKLARAYVTTRAYGGREARYTEMSCGCAATVKKPRLNKKGKKERKKRKKKRKET